MSSGQGHLLGRSLRAPALRRDGTETPVELVVNGIALSGRPAVVGLLRDGADGIELEGPGDLADRLVASLAESASLEEAWPRVLAALVELLNWDLAQLWLADDAEALMNQVHAWARPDSNYVTFVEASSLWGPASRGGYGPAGPSPPRRSSSKPDETLMTSPWSSSPPASSTIHRWQGGSRRSPNVGSPPRRAGVANGSYNLNALLPRPAEPNRGPVTSHTISDEVRAELAPEPTSVSRARRIVEEALERWKVSELADTAILVVSELVTNAFLHAGTPALLILRRRPGGLRVELADSSPGLPAAKDYAPDAATGRGLGIVALLAADWGVEAHPTGKKVWAELNAGEDRPRQAPAADLDRWDDLEPARAAAAPPPPTESEAERLVEVTVVGLPVQLQHQSAEHFDELSREFQLIASDSGEHHVSARLLQMASELTNRYSGFTAAAQERLREAHRAGVDHLDVAYRIPADIGEAARNLSQLLDEADAYCRSGEELLTLATPDDLVRFRGWLLDEFANQAAGHPPAPWPPAG